MTRRKDITELLKENECELIGKYKNNREKFTIKNKIGYKADIVFKTLESKKIKNGTIKTFFNRNNPYCLENMNLYCKLNRPDFEVIKINTDEKFKGKLAVDVKHECGQMLSIRWANFTSKTRPTKCKCNGNYTWTKENFEFYVKEHHKDIELLSSLDGPAYLTDIKCKCKICGNEWTTKANQLTKKETYHCLECLRLSRINSDLTEEDRRNSRDNMEIKQWKRKVYEKDNFTCQCCKDQKSKPLNAHHKNSWNWDKENRFNVNNGITLCEKCHKKFHSIYGYGNNTEEQYKEFINNKGDNSGNKEEKEENNSDN